jgi:phosphatidate cytidylyltransferase
VPAFPSGLAAGRYFYLPAAAFWLIAGAGLAATALASRQPGLALATGSVLLLPVWLALVQLRQAGPLALLAIMAVVWLADIGAYFAGRRFGKHKLAPATSAPARPGKVRSAVACWCSSMAAPVIEAAGDAGREPAAVAGARSGAVDGDQCRRRSVRVAAQASGGPQGQQQRILPGSRRVLDRIDSLTSTCRWWRLVWLVTKALMASGRLCSSSRFLARPVRSASIRWMWCAATRSLSGGGALCAPAGGPPLRAVP